MGDCINIITANKSGRTKLEIPRDIYVDYFYEDVSITVRRLSKEDKLDLALLFSSKHKILLLDSLLFITASSSNDVEYLRSYNKESMEECEKVLLGINNALYVITICVEITDGAVNYPTLLEFLCVPKEDREIVLDSRQEEELTKFLKNEVRTSIYDFYKLASKSSIVNEINSEKEIQSIFAKHIENIPYVDIICRCDNNANLFDQHKSITTYKFG